LKIAVDDLAKLKAENAILQADNRSFKSDIDKIKTQLGVVVNAEKQ